MNLVVEGCHLAISDVNETGLAETADIARARGVRVTTHTADVADRGQVKRYADDVVKAHGGVHLLINNAGVVVTETIEDVSYEDFKWLMGINLWGWSTAARSSFPT